MADNNIYGTWFNGLTSAISPILLTAFLPIYKGFHYRFDWADWETSANTWNDSYVTTNFQTAYDNSLPLTFEVFPSPVNSGISPAYLFSAPYSVPKVNTTVESYPYYYNSAFKTRFDNMYSHVISYIDGLPSGWQTLVKAWESDEGSTGDYGAYKGTINSVTINGSTVCTGAGCSSYDIPIDQTWIDWKQDDIWTPYYSDILATIPYVKPFLNADVSGISYGWIRDNVPPSWFKAATATKDYNMSGESVLAERLLNSDGDNDEDGRWRGEFEESSTLSWWLPAPKANFFALACSCLHSGVDVISANPNYLYNMASTDLYGYQFFNKYAGIRNVSETNVGFCALRGVIDIADTTKYSVATYGTLVSSANLAAYTSKYNAITVDPNRDYWAKQYAYVTLLTSGNSGATYVNTTRANNLRTAFPTATYRNSGDTDFRGDNYNQDFGVYMIPDNYYKYITQYSPDTTSIPIWRLGATTSWYGRFARATDYASGKTKMYFSVDDGLDNNGTSGNNVTLSVVYYDSGTTIWGVSVYTLKGIEEVMNRQNTNTNQWLTASITFDGFLFGGNLANSTDITLNLYSPNQNVTFSLIEFKNNSKTV